MTTFLLIRHALTKDVDKTISGWRSGVHLNEEGKAQTERLAIRLRQASIAALYSSPLERARETADAIAKVLALPVQICNEIGEIQFGEWTGRSLDELSSLPRWQQFNALRSSTRIPGGELMLEVQARMVTVLDRLRQQHESKVVALVSHGDVIKAAVAHYTGIPLDLFHRLEISPASVSILTLDEYGPKIVRVNDTGEGEDRYR